MRIVAGEFRGRRIAEPTDRSIRPTSDRVREAVFNVLAHAEGVALDGARVVDLFAGTGAMGLEALSRGARFALFVDQGLASRGLLRTNIEAMGLTGRTKVWRRDATAMGEATLAPFGLAFADPPYGAKLGERAAASLVAGGWLEPDATLVLEEEASQLPDVLAGFETVDRRTFGRTAVGFFRRAAGRPAGADGADV